MSIGCRQEIEVGAYLLDGLEPAERARFTQHLSGCQVCRVEVAQLEPTAWRLLTFGESLRETSAPRRHRPRDHEQVGDSCVRARNPAPGDTTTGWGSNGEHMPTGGGARHPDRCKVGHPGSGPLVIVHREETIVTSGVEGRRRELGAGCRTNGGA
jgi:hypothetical protein